MIRKHKQRLITFILGIVAVFVVALAGITLITSQPSQTAHAASVSDLTFTLQSDGTYSVKAKSTSISGSLTIPATYNGKKVTAISSNAFASSKLTSVTIENGITTVGVGAFYNISSLVSITIPDSVTSIEGSCLAKTAFYEDSSNWSNNVLYVGNHLIMANSSVTGSYEIKAGTRTIADSAFFAGGAKVSSVIIPTSVSNIGKQAFYNISTLKTITYAGTKAQWNNITKGTIAIPDNVAITFAD